MAKLYFRHGTVGSAKTMNLLAIAHSYNQQSKRAYTVKPRLDTRFGELLIRSRAGLEAEADLLVDEHSSVLDEIPSDVALILIDEAQFLPRQIIEDFRVIATERNIPVIAYGLRTDFRTQTFEGSQRLLELADTIEEVKSSCNYCSKKAVFNLRLQGGLPTLEGASIELGLEDKYLPACATCFNELHKKETAVVFRSLGNESITATH